MNRIKIADIVAVVELLICFFFSGSAFLVCFDSTIYTRFLIIFTLFAFVLYLFVTKTKKTTKDNHNNLICISFFIFLVILSSIVNFPNFSLVVSVRGIFTIALSFLTLLTFSSPRSFFKAFVSIMVIVSVVNILCFVLFNTIGLSYSWFPIMKSNSADVYYHTLIVFNIISSASSRCCGPFWEPSIFASFLSISLFISYFVLHKKLPLIFLIIAILFTQSAGGLLSILLFVLMIIWDKGKAKANSSETILLRLSTIFVLLLFIPLFQIFSNWLLSINYNLFSRLINFREHGSSMARINSFLTDMIIWSKHPIFGTGFDGLETAFLTERENFLVGDSLSHASTTSAYFAAFGLLGGLLMNYMFVKGIIDKHRGFIWNVLALIFFFISINETPQISFALTYILLFALFSNRVVTKKANRNLSFLKIKMEKNIA